MNKRVIASITAMMTAVAMTLAPAVSFASDSVITKDETVYVVTDSTGLQQDVIVSEHLSNEMKVKNIKDRTDLKDIENVKGDEKFTQNDQDLTWAANGNDIYYQGTTTKQVPVKMNISYKLDGQEISGANLQGKSGKVEINIKYTNEAKYNSTTVPLVVMSGMMINDDSFADVKVDHGKVIDQGDSQIVMGMALPGLSDSIDLKGKDIGLSDSVKITGTAKKFAVEDIMTIATNSVFEDVNTDDLDLDYDDKINQLNKGAKKLVNGSEELYSGLDQLNDKTGELEKGVKKLNQGTKKLLNALKDLSKGAQSLASGANQVSQGMAALSAGVNGSQSQPGLAAGAKQISAGVDGVSGALNESMKYDGAVLGQLAELEGQIKANENLSDEEKAAYLTAIGTMKAEIGGSLQYQQGASSGLSSLKDGAGKLEGGINSVSSALNGDGTSANPGLVAGSASVASGASKLAGGIGEAAGTSSTTLIGGASQLAKGMDDLDKNSGKLIDGIGLLNGGASKLSSGMEKLYKDGIKKIVDLYNGDLKGLTKGLDDVMDAGKGYKTFTILPSNMDGSVKFVYKTVISEDSK